MINYDLPVKHDRQSEPDYEVYLHRIGRAGRFGRKGLFPDLRLLFAPTFTCFSSGGISHEDNMYCITLNRLVGLVFHILMLSILSRPSYSRFLFFHKMRV